MISTIQRKILAGSTIPVTPPAFFVFFPSSLTLFVDFLLPNWNIFLQFINCKMYSLQRILSVRRGYSDDNTGLGDLHHPQSVVDRDLVTLWPLAAILLTQLLQLLVGHSLVG